MLEENTDDQTTHESSSSWFTILNHVENDVAQRCQSQVTSSYDRQTNGPQKQDSSYTSRGMEYE